MAKNDVLTQVMGVVDENLPAILTYGGVLTAMATTGYSVWAGWKIKEVVEDETLDQKQKTIRIAKLSLPILGGAVISGTCVVSAHKEHEARYVGVAGLYAASKVDKKKLEEKAKELIGEEKVEEIKKEIKQDEIKKKCDPVAPGVPLDKPIWIHDTVTGYVFQTTMADFWDTVSEFNDLLDSERSDIGHFYEMLLGDKYEYANVHDDVEFGLGTNCAGFSPHLGSEVARDLTQVYTIEYRRA